MSNLSAGVKRDFYVFLKISSNSVHTSKSPEQSPKTEVTPNFVVLFSKLENSSGTRFQFFSFNLFLSDSETA